MIWRDSRGRFVRAPKTAIKAVEVAVYPTRAVSKGWKPERLLTRALAAMRSTIGGEMPRIGDSGYQGETALAKAISNDRLADMLESQSEAIRALDLEGARIWMGVRLANGRTVPLSLAYTRTDQMLARAYDDLRQQLNRYPVRVGENADEDEDDIEPIELPPEPIRYNRRDARGRFTK